MKSPPELWAELSEVEGLARHLGEFGEITITRAQPETTVAWEGDSARGIVELEPTGWGTKVTITAEVPEPPEAPPGAVEPDPAPFEPDPGPFDPEPDPFDPEPEAFEPEPEAFEPKPAEPELEIEPVPEPQLKARGFFSRWLYRERRGAAEPMAQSSTADLPLEREPELPSFEPEPEPELEPEPEPEPQSQGEERLEGPDEDFEFDFTIRRGSAEDEVSAEEEPEPAVIEPDRARAVLEAALESLGQAHHRPFSRG